MMKRQIKKLLIASAVLAANYYLMPLSVNDPDSAMIILLLLMPGLTLTLCFACGCSSISWLFPFLSVILFALSIPLYFTMDALGMIIVYALISCIGFAAGRGIRLLIRRDQKRAAGH